MKNVKIHDYNICKYEVNCSEKSITLYLKYKDEENIYYKNVEFKDVLTHNFYNIMEGNIILDLEVLDFSDLFNDYEISNELLSYLGNTKNIDEVIDNLKGNYYKCYEINSSYGLSGWIIAKEIIFKD